jgi:hypothetical protein
MTDKSTMSGCASRRLVHRLALVLSIGLLPGPLIPAAAAEDALGLVARDSFYDPPVVIPRAGTLLRSEPLSGRKIPERAQAWRILYATTFANGSAATAVATVLAPATPTSSPRPVVMWLHSTVGVAQKCMPSLWTQPFAEIPAVREALEAGWVIVATDYATAGLADSPHEYLIGAGEARSGLDSVRAARQVKNLNLDRDHTVVWGYSQGGGSALWAGIVGPRYAPDVLLAGIAAIAPATDMAKIVALMDPTVAALITWYLGAAYSSFFPDVKLEESLDARALEALRRVAQHCTLDLTPILAEFGQFKGPAPVPDLARGTLGQRVKENIPSAAIAAPLLIAQGLSDDIIQPSVTDGFVNERCAAGQTLDYWVVPSGTHQSLLLAGSTLYRPLFEWTRDRFAGKPQTQGCHARAIAGK